MKTQHMVQMLITCLCGALAHATDVRVGLANARPAITLVGQAFGCATNPTAAATLPAANRINGRTVITPTTAGLQVGQQPFATTTLWCHATQGTFSLDGRQLPPMVQIIRDAAPQVTVVAPIPLESYLMGVVGAEMPASWPAEALRAQAIIARSYTIAKIRHAPPAAHFDVTADTDDQMYSASPPTPRVQAAVRATQGQTLVDAQGRLFMPHYHSCCGGRTAVAQTIWPDAAPLEQSVLDRTCARCPNARWTVALNRAELESALAKRGYAVTPPLHTLTGSGTRAEPRHTSITLTHGGAPLVLPANTFREIVGYTLLKSTWFAIRPTHTGWSLIGHGFGHGAGLCQWGAKAQAEQGRTAAQILKFYYPESVVQSE